MVFNAFYDQFEILIIDTDSYNEWEVLYSHNISRPEWTLHIKDDHVFQYAFYKSIL